jgi:hypothetical protein
MALRRSTADVAHANIRNREAFSLTHLRGLVVTEETHAADLHPGELCYDPEATIAFKAARDAGQIAYAVYSYTTPIAWTLRDGNTYLVEMDYSATTRGHKRIVREAWSL